MDDDTADLMRKLLSLVSRYPDGAFTTTDGGGVRIEWRRGEKSAHLDVSRGLTYLYHSDLGDREIIVDPTPEVLERLLD